jgi:hypothetical protein
MLRVLLLLAAAFVLSASSCDLPTMATFAPSPSPSPVSVEDNTGLYEALKPRAGNDDCSFAQKEYYKMLDNMNKAAQSPTWEETKDYWHRRVDDSKARWEKACSGN